MHEYIDKEDVVMAVSATNPHFSDRLLIIGKIREIPAADVRPVVHGNWVGIDDEPFTTWECDICGCIYEGDFEYMPNFCPNFGADMRKEERNENK